MVTLFSAGLSSTLTSRRLLVNIRDSDAARTVNKCYLGLPAKPPIRGKGGGVLKNTGKLYSSCFIA